MEVILLERVPKLGHLGETVKVKDGYARNFLLRRGKALRATEANKKHFEAQRAELEAKNADRRTAAQNEAKSLDGKSFVIIRQAGESGQLYGSVSPRTSPKQPRLPACMSNAPTSRSDQDHRYLQRGCSAPPRSGSEDQRQRCSPKQPRLPACMSNAPTSRSLRFTDQDHRSEQQRKGICLSRSQPFTAWL